MGGDDYETVKVCGQNVYQQLKSMKEVIHPITGQKLTVLRRTTADGKARRTSTGSSTACSAFPIPEAPEHIDQLGDMKLLFVQPTWSLEETEKARLTHISLNTIIVFITQYKCENYAKSVLFLTKFRTYRARNFFIIYYTCLNYKSTKIRHNNTVQKSC